MAWEDIRIATGGKNIFNAVIWNKTCFSFTPVISNRHNLWPGIEIGSTWSPYLVLRSDSIVLQVSIKLPSPNIPILCQTLNLWERLVMQSTSINAYCFCILHVFCHLRFSLTPLIKQALKCQIYIEKAMEDGSLDRDDWVDQKLRREKSANS